MTQSDMELELELSTGNLNCTSDDVTMVFAGLLGEMRTAIQHIHGTERKPLRKIMSEESGTLTVADVFPDFARHSEAHQTLRRLRTAQFILPVGRDKWGRDTLIAIKPFARLVWDRIGEAILFDDLEIASEEIDLAIPEVNEPDAEAGRAKGKNKNAEIWEDDDVLDFLKGTKDEAE